MKLTKILSLMAVLVGSLFTMFIACTKNTNPTPPVHDTTTLVKRDTTHLTDTVYTPPKPDSTVNLTKGLLLYLPFTGNIADSSGNGNPTAYIGNVLTYDTHGWANNAFGSDGSGNNEVFVTNNGSINFDTAFSVSFGFMVNDSNATQSFVSMVNPVNGYGASFDLGLTDPTTNYFCFGAGDISSSCNGVVTNNVVDTTRFVPNPGSWYQCICIYHRGGVQIYMNGALISSKQSSWTEAIVCPSAQVVIGGWWNYGNRLNINGKLDNVRMYNRVLTPHEIAALSSNYQIHSNSMRPGLKTH